MSKVIAKKKVKSKNTKIKDVSKKPSRLTQDDWNEMKNSRSTRKELAKEDLFWFFHLYFGHYITYETATFQKEIFCNISNPRIEHLVIVAFRGSGKSTIVSTAYPIWAMIGHMQKKFIVIVSQTQNQAQQHLRNLRAEIESNELFRNDFGNLEEESNEWGISSLNMPKLGAKIVAVSREQGIRGIRSGPHRPDLVISDDIEDTQSVKTREGRNKTYNWFTSEIMPIGSQKTKFVTIGNLLHEDSLLMRLKDGFAAGTHDGEYHEYPIAIKNKTMWPGAYPGMDAIDKQKRRIGNRIAWEREYMLKIIPEEDQVVTKSMIKTYETMPDKLHNESERIFIGIDLAISAKDTADYTAMIRLVVRGTGKKRRLYVQPKPINKRFNFNQTLDQMRALKNDYPSAKFIVETTAFQASVKQVAEAEGFDIQGFTPKEDKRARLNMIASYIERGLVIFPENGAELLIAQLTGFGVEKHDDLMDALTMTVLEIMKEKNDDCFVGFVPFRLDKLHLYTPREKRYINRKMEERGIDMRLSV